jgi:hypothetical protein
MPVVIFFACLGLEQKSSFMDGHESGQNKFLKDSEKLPLGIM